MNGKPPRKGRPFARSKICRFCADGKKEINDPKTLRYFISERGKIIPRRISGNCSKHQTEIINAIKTNREAFLKGTIKVAVGDHGASCCRVGPHGPRDLPPDED